MLCWGLLCLSVLSPVSTEAGSIPASDSKILRQRVDAFWMALKDAQVEAAAALVDPHQAADFRRRRLLPVQSWHLRSLSVAASEVEALVVLDCVLAHPQGRFPTRVSQKWVLADGNWWLSIPVAAAADINRLLYGSSTGSSLRSPEAHLP